MFIRDGTENEIIKFLQGINERLQRKKKRTVLLKTKSEASLANINKYLIVQL